MARHGLIALFLLFILMPVQAAAHKPSDSYLSLDVQDSSVEGRWDMALRDLDHAIGLDGDGDGAITWGELQTRHGAVTAYALARLEIKSDARVCPAVATDHLVDNHSDGAYAVLRFTATCATPIDDLDVAYSLLFDLDPLHRGLLQVNHGGRNYTTVLGPERSTWSLRAALRQARSTSQARAASVIRGSRPGRGLSAKAAINPWRSARSTQRCTV